jgi:hypothetical protein
LPPARRGERLVARLDEAKVAGIAVRLEAIPSRAPAWTARSDERPSSDEIGPADAFAERRRGGLS